MLLCSSSDGRIRCKEPWHDFWAPRRRLRITVVDRIGAWNREVIRIMAEPRVILPGSERGPIVGAETIGPADPSERIAITLEIRGSQQPPPGAPMTCAELQRRFSAAPADLTAIRQFATQNGLQVLSESPAKRLVRLGGSSGALSAAFGTTLTRVRVGNAIFRQRVGAITVPHSLKDVILAVVGLDDRPQVSPRLVRPPGQVGPLDGGTFFSPLDIAKIYNFPAGDGSSQTVAMLEMGGGFTQDDLNAYFGTLGVPIPTVTAVSVLGATNSPGVDPPSDAEVTLDIEIAGAIAPRANILVYFAPNTDQGFLEGIKGSNPRQSPAARGHLHQLGRSGNVLERPVNGGRRPSFSGCGPTRHSGLCRFGRRGIDRRDNDSGRRFPGFLAKLPRLWRHVPAAERQRGDRSSMERFNRGYRRRRQSAISIASLSIQRRSTQWAQRFSGTRCAGCSWKRCGSERL